MDCVTHNSSPMSMMRHTDRPSRVCVLRPIERASASTPPDGQCPAGWQAHTLMVRVLVLDRAGEPLSIMTTGR